MTFFNQVLLSIEGKSLKISKIIISIIRSISMSVS